MLGVMVLFTVVPIVACHAEFITNGGFELQDVSGTFSTLNAGSTVLTGWTVLNGGIDLINTYWEGFPSNTQSVDLNATSPGGVRQTVQGLTTGQQYVLSFYYSGNPDLALRNQDSYLTKILNVSWNPDGVASDLAWSYTYTVPSPGQHLPSPMNWIQAHTTVTAGTNNVLTFSGGNSGPCGATLDFVSMSEADPLNYSVPEPTSLALLPLALTGLMFWRRRRTA